MNFSNVYTFFKAVNLFKFMNVFLLFKNDSWFFPFLKQRSSTKKASKRTHGQSPSERFSFSRKDSERIEWSGQLQRANPFGVCVSIWVQANTKRGPTADANGWMPVLLSAWTHFWSGLRMRGRSRCPPMSSPDPPSVAHQHATLPQNPPALAPWPTRPTPPPPFPPTPSSSWSPAPLARRSRRRCAPQRRRPPRRRRGLDGGRRKRRKKKPMMPPYPQPLRPR